MQLGIGLSLGSGFAIPLCGKHRINRDAKATLVHEGQVSLRTWIALVSGFPLPKQSSRVVRRNAATVKVDSSQFILCGRITLARGLGKPVDRLFSIRLNMPAKVVAGGQGRLGYGIICGNSFLDGSEICGFAGTDVRPAILRQDCAKTRYRDDEEQSGVAEHESSKPGSIVWTVADGTIRVLVSPAFNTRGERIKNKSEGNSFPRFER